MFQSQFFCVAVLTHARCFFIAAQAFESSPPMDGSTFHRATAITYVSFGSTFVFEYPRRRRQPLIGSGGVPSSWQGLACAGHSGLWPSVKRVAGHPTAALLDIRSSGVAQVPSHRLLCRRRGGRSAGGQRGGCLVPCRSSHRPVCRGRSHRGWLSLHRLSQSHHGAPHPPTLRTFGFFFGGGCCDVRCPVVSGRCDSRVAIESALNSR